MQSNDLTPEQRALMAVGTAFEQANLTFDHTTGREWLGKLRDARTRANSAEEFDHALRDTNQLGTVGEEYADYGKNNSLDLYDSLKTVVERTSDDEGMYQALVEAYPKFNDGTEHPDYRSEFAGHSADHVEYDGQTVSSDVYYEEISPGYVNSMYEKALDAVTQDLRTATIEPEHQRAIAAELVRAELSDTR